MKRHRLQQVRIAALVLIILGGCSIFVLAPKAEAWTQQLETIGVSLFMAGVVSLFLDRVALAILLGEVDDKLTDALDDFKLIRHGIRSVVKGPFYDQVYERLRYSNRFILIQTWSPDLTNLLLEAEQVFSRGGQVEIFLLHPESTSAIQRGIDLGPGAEHVPGKIRSDTRDVRARYRQLRNKSEGSFKLFYYASLPAFALYAVDDRAWVGSYWYAAQADTLTTLVVDVPSPFWCDYEKHINELRKKSISVPLDSDDEPALPSDSISKS